MTKLYHYNSIALPHTGDCSLLAIGQDLTIYVEEIHGEHITQHRLHPDGRLLQSVADDQGRLDIPPDAVQPQPGQHTAQLNFVGARHRGMRDDERIQNLVRPFTVQTKMTLGKRLGVMPPLILGLAESYVLTEASLGEAFVVCRRIRIAYALEKPQTDDYGQSYDYDSVQMHIAHRYDASVQGSLSPDEAFAGLPGAELNQPMDCMTAQDHLFIADSGSPNTIHVWTF